jgi:hypothetical protein
MVELTDAEFEAASQRGDSPEGPRRAPNRRATIGNRPCDRGRYERLHISFPPRLAQGLETESDDQLEQPGVLGPDKAPHWESLDVDLSIPGLLAAIFGTRAYLDDRFRGNRTNVRTGELAF